jgi:hypothetical protein
MTRPPEIPPDLWDVLTVRVAGAARLLPLSCDSEAWEGRLVKDEWEDGTPAARLLVLRCRDEGGKFSKGMRMTMAQSLRKARKLLKLKDPTRKNPQDIRRNARDAVSEADAAMAALKGAVDAMMEGE